MRELRFCRFCRAAGIRTVLVVEDYDTKTRTAHHCPACGEILAVVWARKKKA